MAGMIGMPLKMDLIFLKNLITRASFSRTGAIPVITKLGSYFLSAATARSVRRSSLYRPSRCGLCPVTAMFILHLLVGIVDLGG